MGEYVNEEYVNEEYVNGRIRRARQKQVLQDEMIQQISDNIEAATAGTNLNISAGTVLAMANIGSAPSMKKALTL